MFLVDKNNRKQVRTVLALMSKNILIPHVFCLEYLSVVSLVAHKMKINIIFYISYNVSKLDRTFDVVFVDVAIRGCLSRGLFGRKVCVGGLGVETGGGEGRLKRKLN